MDAEITPPLNPIAITSHEVSVSLHHPPTETDTAASLLGVLDEILAGVSQEGRKDISSSHLAALNCLFPDHILEAALDLVDVGGVTSHALNSTPREVFTVEGGSGRRYLCFKTSSYCSCPSFTYNVLVKRDALLCKHQLAVRLASVLGRTTALQVGETEWTELITLDQK